MKLTDKVSLHLTPSGISAYCDELQRSTATPEKRLIALDALRTFIITAVEPEFINDETFERIKAILLSEIERASAELMEVNLRLLAAALQRHDISKISQLFNSLSRSGFWEILTLAMSRMDATPRKEVSMWASQWLEEAKRRGEEASPYPDSIDFVAAEIEITEYTAMTDIGKYLDYA
ncbi:MAG: hypothetical protein ABFS08_03305 [Pseudomonadota bacterium]